MYSKGRLYKLGHAKKNFFFLLGFYGLSRIFHLYRADRSSKVVESRRTLGKTTWPSVSRTWLSHIWPKPGANHSCEKHNGLRVNSIIHKATGALLKCYFEPYLTSLLGQPDRTVSILVNFPPLFTWETFLWLPAHFWKEINSWRKGIAP